LSVSFRSEACQPPFRLSCKLVVEDLFRTEVNPPFQAAGLILQYIKPHAVANTTDVASMLHFNLQYIKLHVGANTTGMAVMLRLIL